MIEKYFPTKNCRSVKKIAQLRQVLKSNIYRTEKYFVKL